MLSQNLTKKELKEKNKVLTKALVNAKRHLQKLLPQAIDKDNKHEYRLGPLPLSESTKTIEKIVQAFLHTPDEVKLYYDDKNYLLVQLPSDEKPIPLTAILQAAPNFEHIQLTEKDFEAYLQFVKTSETKASEKEKTLLEKKTTPQIGGSPLTKKIESPKALAELSKTDPLLKKGGSEKDLLLALHKAEENALFAYSSDDKYQIYNNFFRDELRKKHDDLPVEGPPHFKLIREIILVSAVATSAAKKLSHINSKGTSNLGFRVDYKLSSNIIEDRKKVFQENSLFYEPAFLSTSDFKLDLGKFPFIPGAILESKSLPKPAYTLIIGEGRHIDKFSYFPKEKEKLFGLGSTFAPLIFEETAQGYFFIYKHVAALKPLTAEEKQAWELEVKKEKLTQTQDQNKDSHKNAKSPTRYRFFPGPSGSIVAVKCVTPQSAILKKK